MKRRTAEQQQRRADPCTLADRRIGSSVTSFMRRPGGSGSIPARAATARRAVDRKGVDSESGTGNVIFNTLNKHLTPPSSSTTSATSTRAPASRLIGVDMDIPDKETVARDEKALMERGSDLLTMVTQLGSSERLAEANELSKAKSIEDAVSTVMQTKAAGEINQIVAKAKDVITSEEAKRTLTAKGADLVVATDKWISGGKDSVKSLEVATQSGIDKLIELSDKGEVTKLGKNVIKSAEKVLAELSEGKGLSSSELEAWKSYVLSSNDEAKQASLLANDPNLQEILNKANQLLTRPAAVSLIKNYMGVLKTGAGALVDGAGKLLQDKKSQALLREWTQTGIGVIRTVTADKVYVINKGFKFHVRSEPTMSKSKKTGKVFRSGQMFTVDEVKRDPLGRQTYLHLADNSGWVFTDHPNPKDSRKLISQVSMVDEKGAQSAGTEEKKGSEFASAQKSLVYRGHKLLDITGKRFLGKGADTLLSQGSKIVQHKQTRDKFLREIKDASVEFLLSYLPTLKVGVIEGVKDNVKYKLWDIDLSGFKLVSEKVDVAFDEEALELKVTASNLSCKMQGLSWQYKQQTFPYMSGTGKADAFAADADFRFVLKIEFVTKDEAQRRRREILEREKKRLDEKKKVSAFQVAGRKLRTDKLKRISPAGSDTKQIAGSSGSGQALDSDAKRKPGEQPAPITGEKTPGTKRGSGQSSTERVRPDDEGELSGGVQRDEGNERGDDEAQPSDEAERKGSDLVLQVSLKEKRMRISALDLTFDTGGSLGTWFYNKVASIFKESIRWYVEQHLNTALDDYSGLLVDIGNKYAQQYYPLLFNIVTATQRGIKKAKKTPADAAAATTTAPASRTSTSEADS